MDIGGVLQDPTTTDDAGPVGLDAPRKPPIHPIPVPATWTRRRGLHLAYATGTQQNPGRAISAVERAAEATTVGPDEDRMRPLTIQLSARRGLTQELKTTHLTASRERMLQSRAKLAELRTATAGVDSPRIAAVVPITASRSQAQRQTRRRRPALVVAATGAAAILGPFTLAAAQMDAHDEPAAVHASIETEDPSPAVVAPTSPDNESLMTIGLSPLCRVDPDATRSGFCLVLPAARRSEERPMIPFVDPASTVQADQQEADPAEAPDKQVQRTSPAPARRTATTPDGVQETSRPTQARHGASSRGSAATGQDPQTERRPRGNGNPAGRQETGRPAHSHSTGRPDHAKGPERAEDPANTGSKGRPAHSYNTGRQDRGNSEEGKGRPAHADQSGRPDHAADKGSDRGRGRPDQDDRSGDRGKSANAPGRQR